MVQGEPEPCAPYSTHGSILSNSQFDPTQNQKHSLAHDDNSIQNHEGNKNRAS